MLVPPASRALKSRGSGPLLAALDAGRPRRRAGIRLSAILISLSLCRPKGCPLQDPHERMVTKAEARSAGRLCRASASHVIMPPRAVRPCGDGVDKCSGYHPRKGLDDGADWPD